VFISHQLHFQSPQPKAQNDIHNRDCPTFSKMWEEHLTLQINKMMERLCTRFSIANIWVIIIILQWSPHSTKILENPWSSHGWNIALEHAACVLRILYIPSVFGLEIKHYGGLWKHCDACILCIIFTSIFFGHQDAKVLAKNKNTDHTKPIWTTAQ